MSEFLMYLTNGVVIGVINAISAIGVSLIVGIMRVVNFAHGELYIFAGYFSYHLSTSLGVPPLLAMPLSVVFVFFIGIGMERTLIRPTYGDEMYSLIITFVLSIVLQNAALLIFGPYPNKPPNLLTGATNMFGLYHYGNQRLLSFFISIGILLLVFYLIKKTWFGKSIRAVSQDRGMASLIGVDHFRVNMLSFGLGAALAGAAGVIVAPIFPVTPTGSSAISLTAFVVVVLGGMGSLKGCVVGGLLLGILENLGAAYISTMYRNIFGFIILILVLVFRPWGLYG
ncbi:MAG TPA: branched-chain amino acid ABC transporter permease, partial [Thermodesulfobacteriota bacterium]|nr:branched-chain amino acid ABC transporter permease [Thermodesulfobacteriota bacterium]